MNVNFLIDSVHPFGTYFRSLHLARALTNLGCSIRVFGIDYNPGAVERVETRDGLAYHIVPSCRGQRFFGQHHHPIVSIHRSMGDYGNCDVLHMFEPFLTTYLPWRQLLNQRRSPQKWFDWADLWAAGGLLDEHPKKHMRDRWERFWANRIESVTPKLADGMTVCSKWLADLAAKRGAKKTVLVHHGVWPIRAEPLENSRSRFGLRPDSRYLGFMGRTISPTEFGWCLDALRASADHFDVRLAVCGPLDHLMQAVPKDLRQRIDYLGVLDANDCRRFAQSLDFALLPLEDTPFNISRYPLKFSDYLAAGARIIVSDVGECAEIAKTIPGVTLAGKGPYDWISAVRSALSALESGTAQTVNRHCFESLLAWESIAANLLNSYRELA